MQQLSAPGQQILLAFVGNHQFDPFLSGYSASTPLLGHLRPLPPKRAEKSMPGQPAWKLLGQLKRRTGPKAATQIHAGFFTGPAGHRPAICQFQPRLGKIRHIENSYRVMKLRRTRTLPGHSS